MTMIVSIMYNSEIEIWRHHVRQMTPSAVRNQTVVQQPTKIMIRHKFYVHYAHISFFIINEINWSFYIFSV